MQAPARIIEKKRDGQELTPEEIQDFIRGLSDGTVADYQASAFLMAVYFNGMSVSETVALTEAMLKSGERYDLASISGPKVDKHSTGGVGDKVSIVLAPLAAACGLKVPMMSGRGLGHSGGTLDKLEAITGFNVNLPRAAFERNVNSIGCCMIGQSATIAPADKKLYALRDVTGTVECIPLIVASILSKKAAEGTHALVLDVKAGNGAFMKTPAQAKRLARALITVGNRLGLKCRAVISSMDQPLGYAVGNSLEIIESLEILQNGHRGIPALPGGATTGEVGSADLKELTLQLCAQMLEAAKAVPSLAAGRKLAQAKLSDGSAYRLFLRMVEAQGGSTSMVHHPEELPLSKRRVVWKTKRRGFISRIQTTEIGRILVEMGGGRKRASDTVDPSVGFVFHKKLGAKVQPGEPLVTVFAPENADLGGLEKAFQAAVEVSSHRKAVSKLILDVIVK